MSQKNSPVTTAAPEYDITILGRHVEVTDAIKAYAREKVGKIERFHGKVLEIHVTMDVIKLEHRVDIVVKIDHTKIAVHSITDNMYASVDLATDKLMRVMRRYRARIREHHARGVSVVDVNVNLINRPVDELADLNEEIEIENYRELEEKYRPHEIVASKTEPLKTLGYGDAIMKMELSNDPFMVFRSEEDKKLKVIYRRNDEQYGIIEPE